MRFLSVLTVGLLISSTAIAQSQTFAIHPGSTSYTSRGNLGTGSGELLMGLHTSHWRGLGDNGRACEVTQLGLVDQDQNSNTQETFHLVLRNGTDANGPGTGATDLIGRFGPLSMPSTPTGSVNAWIQTTTLSTPQAVPCEAHFGWGAELTASSNWSSDGMSVHTAFSRTNRNMQYCHLNSEPHGYYFPAGAAQATADTGNARTWRLRMGVSAANNVLQMGATGTVLGGGANQRYGMNGMFPNTGETLSARYTQCTAGATVQSYVSFGYGTGLSLTAGTRLYLNPAFFMMLVGSTAVGGNETHLFGATPATPAVIGPVAFQGAIIDAGSLALSNGNSTSILP
jgi:hypothetical protein